MAHNYHLDGTAPPPKVEIAPGVFRTWVLVFGSNLAGRHGKGAAEWARREYGAVPGKGYGRYGDSFALPTKDYQMAVLSLDAIELYVNKFRKEVGSMRPEEVALTGFFFTRLGCGLARYKDSDIAPMFRNFPGRCSFAIDWRPYLE